MRSDLVFAARHRMVSRFTLCQAAAKAARKFHRANTRMEDTTNEVLQRIAVSERELVVSDCGPDAEDRRKSDLSTHWRTGCRHLSVK